MKDTPPPDIPKVAFKLVLLLRSDNWHFFMLCPRRRLPPASWTGAAVALAALRTVRPLAEPLTSGAGSRPQYQPSPPSTWLLLLISQHLWEFTLESSSLPPGHVLLLLIYAVFPLGGILWLKWIPTHENHRIDHGVRKSSCRHYDSSKQEKTSNQTLKLGTQTKTDVQRLKNITHEYQLLQNSKRGNTVPASLFSLLATLVSRLYLLPPVRFISVCCFGETLWCPTPDVGKRYWKQHVHTGVVLLFQVVFLNYNTKSQSLWLN